MARILIASDIHGDASTAERLVEIYKASGAEKLLLLGDILYHGPRNDLPVGYAPKRVIELLNPLKNEILAVRGNCDTEVDQMVLPNILRESFKDFNDLQIMPESVFSPKSFIDGKIRSTVETYCIHHFSSSWRPESIRKGIERRQALFARFPQPIAKVLALPLALWTNLQTLGVAGSVKKIFKKLL